MNRPVYKGRERGDHRWECAGCGSKLTMRLSDKPLMFDSADGEHFFEAVTLDLTAPCKGQCPKVALGGVAGR